ncbi:Outer membrane protein MIP (Macrophage infectivity potentiator) (Peptidyl-prolyl cis-trans isomerase) (PPIase) (Rotamase) [Durusdinium trenchii]|uniref:peptidylprolyl isomerase n=1 Tax=Durusdinium trenchii TaxID=1381693 RepID=A0ABP0P218_9DINO
MYDLVNLSDARDEFFLPRVRMQCDDLFKAVRDQSSRIFGAGALQGDAFSPYHAFMVLARRFLDHQLVWMNDKLREEGKETADFAELLLFLAQLIVFHRFDENPANGSLIFKGITGEKPMDHPRFTALLKSLTPINPSKEGQFGNGRFGQTVDHIAKMREFEEKLFEATRTVTYSQHRTVVIDDELVGSRSKQVQKRMMSDRKAGRDGIKNDAIADSLHRIMLAVRHHERLHYSQRKAVDEVFSALDGNGSGAANGNVCTGDRGYSKPEFWWQMISRSMPFLAIVDIYSNPFMALDTLIDRVIKKERKAGGEVGPKTDTITGAVARAQAVGMHVKRSLIVHDDPNYGREVFVAKATVTVDSRIKDIRAMAYRDFQSKTTAKTCKVVQFVECDTELGDKLSKTMCMDPLKIPTGMRRLLRSHVLFFPIENKTTSLRDMELQLEGENNVKPAEPRVSTQPPHASDGDFDDSPDPHIVIALSTEEQGGDDDDDDDDDDDMSDVGEDVGNDDDVDAAGNEDEDLNQNPEAGTALDQEDLLSRGAEILARSWLFSRGMSTPEMKSGTINEGNVFDAVGRKDWCKDIFHVGLLARKNHPFLAVSSDGVARVKPPSATPSDDVVIASVEIKTRSAENSLKRARDVAREKGDYSCCSVGDNDWWDVIPDAHRGQVIHQALVLNLEYVLYVEASITKLLYCALIRVPIDVRNTYKDALLKFESLMSWAHESVHTSWTGGLPVPPQQFDQGVQERLVSHLRLWRAVMKKSEDGPLPPVRVFRCLPQVIYNTLKGGLDGHSQNVAVVQRCNTLKLDLNRLLVVRGLHQLVANAFAIFRLVKVCTRSNGFEFPFQSLSGLRNACNELIDLKSFVVQLASACVLHRHANGSFRFDTPPHGDITAAVVDAESSLQDTLTAEEVEQVRNKRPRQWQARQRYFDQGDPKRLRLCAMSSATACAGWVRRARRRMGRWHVAAVAAALVAAAVMLGGVQGGTTEEGLAFLEENKGKPGVVELPSGLQYKVIKPGEGLFHPTADSKCSVHYHGTKIDGSVFDSTLSSPTKQPREFAPNQVIKGWTEAMQLMVEGDKWELYIPSELAYGENGPPEIGAGAVLIFRIELVKIQGDKVPAVRCDASTLEGCNDREQAYVAKQKGKSDADIDKELARLVEMAKARMKPELAEWILRRKSILQQLATAEKQEL